VYLVLVRTNLIRPLCATILYSTFSSSTLSKGATSCNYYCPTPAVIVGAVIGLLVTGTILQWWLTKVVILSRRKFRFGKRTPPSSNTFHLVHWPLVNFTNILWAAFELIFLRQKLQGKTVIREKLRKAILYKKGACKMLVKLTHYLIDNFEFRLACFWILPVPERKCRGLIQESSRCL